MWGTEGRKTSLIRRLTETSQTGGRGILQNHQIRMPSKASLVDREGKREKDNYESQSQSYVKRRKEEVGWLTGRGGEKF